MKTLKLGITLFLLFSTMYSQDRIDPTKIFNKLLDTHRYQPLNTEYVLGWNWSSPGAKLDSALFCTYYHNLNFEDPIKDLIHGNTKLIVPIKHFY